MLEIPTVGYFQYFCRYSVFFGICNTNVSIGIWKYRNGGRLRLIASRHWWWWWWWSTPSLRPETEFVVTQFRCKCYVFLSVNEKKLSIRRLKRTLAIITL